jgi:hypothetical protein
MKAPEPANEVSDNGAASSDWPEPDAASSGASSGPDGPKRKRRRKKGKGSGSQNAQIQAEADPAPPAGPAEGTNAPAPLQQAQPPNQSQRPNHVQGQGQPQGQRFKVDPDLLAKFAWKIYLSEVSEEGVALVGDNDAKELARRCFRLAEIFIEEQSRRR